MYMYLDHAKRQIEQMVAKMVFPIQLKGVHYNKSYKNQEIREIIQT